ncbi:MAG: hypothetical protein AAF487_04095 [Bacteroidota bacterium]
MSLRPPHPKNISLNDLKPGDILLSSGNTWIDKAIEFLDQGDYSHVTQYIDVDSATGDHMVVEATTKGIKYHNTDEDFQAQNLIDAYRFVSVDGHRLGDPGWSADPMINLAKTYAGGNYAYDNLLLLAVMLIACEWPKSEKVSETVRLLLAYVDGKLEKWLNANKGKTPMTCVQVATSCHWDAPTTPPNKYALQVLINGARTAPWNKKNDDLRDDYSVEMLEYNRLRTKITSHLKGIYPDVDISGGAKGIKAYAGSIMLPLGTCTPYDLQTSPTLEFIGCLKDTRSTDPSKHWDASLAATV